MSRKPLVILAAHGSGDGSAANARALELARYVAERRRDAEVVVAFNLGLPGIAEVLAVHSGRRVVVVPLMTSAGYFAGEHLRRQIAATGMDVAGATIAESVGLSEAARDLTSRRVIDAVERSEIDSSCTILVVGHGTRRSSTSGGTTIAAAEAIRERLPEADVRVAFLDQEPLLEDVAKEPLRGRVIVAPFLIGGGEHACADVPERLGVGDQASDEALRVCADGREVLILTPLGEDEEFPAILLRCVDTALPRPALRIGTRSSPLALWQARHAAEMLESAGVLTQFVTIESDGDLDLARPLDAFPTDGPFTDALERALLRGEIDIAVHSLKDLPLVWAFNTHIAAVLSRGAAGEALVAASGLTLEELPQGAKVGTCSQRRGAQLRRLRSDLTPVPIRGTIQQRLEKIRNGEVDAAILAVAGLERLGLQGTITQRFTSDEIMPEAGQGAIALQVRADDEISTAIAVAIDHAPTRFQVEAERLFSRTVAEQTGLIAAVIVSGEGELHLRGRALSPAGSICIDVEHRSSEPRVLALSGVADLRTQVQARSNRAQPPALAGERGQVALVGAGPGDPGLMTLRGMRLLRQADVVIHDRLIDLSLLDEAPAQAERIDAGKSAGRHVLTQDQINMLIVDRALQGKRVVRLKGGDPFIFGRGSEELRECRRAGVPCEVVPGITSAIAAPAAADIPVTARGFARSLAIVTPQSESGVPRSTLDYGALSRMDTVVLLMARSVLVEVAEGFIRAGRSPKTPAAVIQDGTLPTQRQVIGTLADIAHRADEAGLRAPSVVVIGETVGLQGELTGSTTGRLLGKRIVVTRPSSASPGLIEMLCSEGAAAINCPLIRIVYRTPADLSALQHYHAWTVFTSLHAVRGFWRVLQSLGRDARALGPSRIAAVGPKTADELRAIGLHPDLVPDVHRASALVEALTTQSHAQGQRIFFPCGTLARDELRSGLRARGMIVDELEVYETLPQHPSSETIADIHRGVDAILLYCPSAAVSAADAGLLSHDTPIACIGPTTGAKVRELGFEPAVVPAAHTDRGLVDALAEFFQHKHALQGANA